MAAMEERLGQVEMMMARYGHDLNDLMQKFNSEKVEFTDGINIEFAKHSNAMNEVVQSAKKEFEDLRGYLQNLHTKTEQAVIKLESKIEEVDKKTQDQSQGHGRQGVYKGYLPQKNTIPDKFSGKAEDWRMWQEEVSDYFDSMRPGMKKLLEDVEKEADTVDIAWRQKNRGNRDPKVLGDGLEVWRALKKLTHGEAKKIVNNVKNEDGLQAWQKLKQRYEPSLAARQGIVIADFSGMVARPAKVPSETVTLITEIDRKIKLIDDITGEEPSDMHAKSVLVGILDPMTRQHTAMSHSKDYEELKRIVIEFANNSAGNPDAMQLGQFGEADPKDKDICSGGWISDQSWSPAGGEESLGALGKGSSGMQCYTCSGYGHMSRECPSKGKGKAKGGKGEYENGKGKGKAAYQQPYMGKGTYQKGGKAGGGGKGPLEGCWNCGGSHYASSCPEKGGKGKSKGKGLRTLGDYYPEDWRDSSWENGQVKVLSCIQTAHPYNREKVDSCCKRVRGSAKCTSSVCDMHHQEDDDLYAEKEKMQKEFKDNEARQDRGAGQVPSGLDEWQVAVSRKKKRCNKRMKETEAMSIRPFVTIEPEGFNALNCESDWEEIDLAVDSGATETVVNEDMLESIDTKAGPASKRGVEYEVANGVRIPNLGEKKFVAVSEGGTARNITAQVCDVNKALLSVRKVMKAGNRVVFDEEGSFIEDKETNEKIWLREEQGMFMVKMWVKKPTF